MRYEIFKKYYNQCWAVDSYDFFASQKLEWVEYSLANGKLAQCLQSDLKISMQIEAARAQGQANRQPEENRQAKENKNLRIQEIEKQAEVRKQHKYIEHSELIKRMEKVGLSAEHLPRVKGMLASGLSEEDAFCI